MLLDTCAPIQNHTRITRGGEIERNRETERQRDRQAGRQTDRQTDRQRDRVFVDSVLYLLFSHAIQFAAVRLTVTSDQKHCATSKYGLKSRD